ncbi:malonyl CoA-acyl carrier protein transacylase, putative [Bacillus subtilis]|nr:malonyl CoA-acyl carrier protein transacylase, putative [Bacillus subtilis]
MGRITGGGMAAVIGLSKGTSYSRFRKKAPSFMTLMWQNENTPQQIVISGPKKEIEKSSGCF